MDVSFFMAMGHVGLERINATVQWTVARRRLDGINTIL